MAKVTIDKILSEPLMHSHSQGDLSVDVLASAPTNPVIGQMYINSGDDKLYIFWGTWQVLATLTPPAPPTAQLQYLFGFGTPITKTI